MVMIEIPNSSLAIIITTSFPGYDIRISEATSRPNVRKPNTPAILQPSVSLSVSDKNSPENIYNNNIGNNELYKYAHNNIEDSDLTHL